jgi:hypothetical protein
MVALILGFQHPAFLLVPILSGFSTYLFRRGRFVVRW